MNVTTGGGGIDFAKLMATNPAAAAAIEEFAKKEKQRGELVKDLIARFPGPVIAALMNNITNTLMSASPTKLDAAFLECCKLCENYMKKESVTNDALNQVETSLAQLGK